MPAARKRDRVVSSRLELLVEELVVGIQRNEPGEVRVWALQGLVPPKLLKEALALLRIEAVFPEQNTIILLCATHHHIISQGLERQIKATLKLNKSKLQPEQVSVILT